MRSGFIWYLATVLFVISPAMAGELSFVGGRTIWQSTQCPEPAVPASLSDMSPEANAEDVNARVSQYNQYVQQAQDYMNCISAESERDAGATSQAIAAAGQAIIINTQNNTLRLKQSLQAKN